MSSRKRLHVLYSGRVQGVGFRYTAKTVATGFEVTGIVRNLADGRVEVHAQASARALDDFEGRLRIGPPRSEVRTVEVREESVAALDSFRIR